MSLIELFKVALAQISSSKLRSFLTTLGIMLGVWFVISVAAIMESFTEKMVENTSSLGPDVFQVDRYPRNRRRGEMHKQSPRIHPSVAQRLIDRCDHVKIAAAEDSRGGRAIKYQSRETNATFQLYGAQEGFMSNNNWSIDRGRAVNNGDNLSMRSVIVLGADAVNELFYDRSPIGEEVQIDGRSYTVIGTMVEEGNQMGNNRNAQAAIPLSTLHNAYGVGQFVRVTVRATSIFDRDMAIEEVRREMRIINKDQPGEDDSFGMWTNESSAEDMLDFFGNIKIVGFVLGLIALLVGGIGVMNIMLATVKERTREIGIRKSLGARKATILLQFIFESSALCLVGCFIGMAIGLFTGFIFSLIMETGAPFPISDIVLAMILTTVIGVGFGSYPAWKAAKLDPIEALRYE